jgi:enterochelin esterase-like enzyme
MNPHLVPLAAPSPVENLLMRLTLKLALIFIFVASTAWPAESPAAPVKGHVVTTTLHSIVLGRDVGLEVWLPPGYDAAENAARKYPVMYLFDGNGLFDAAGDAKEKMHLDASLDRLVADGALRPIVVVGIEQPKDPNARAEEYKVCRDPLLAPGGSEPHGSRLPEFLVAEVLPKIAASYRVSGERELTGIGGLSYGGAAALYLLMRWPTTFGLAIIESPSLHLGNGQLVRDSEHLFECGERVAIGIGTAEVEPGAVGPRTDDVNRGWVHACEAIAANLRAAYVPPDVHLEIEPGAGHKPDAWARRFPRDLVFVFGKERP